MFLCGWKEGRQGMRWGSSTLEKEAHNQALEHHKVFGDGPQLPGIFLDVGIPGSCYSPTTNCSQRGVISLSPFAPMTFCQHHFFTAHFHSSKHSLFMLVLSPTSLTHNTPTHSLTHPHHSLTSSLVQSFTHSLTHSHTSTPPTHPPTVQAVG